MKKRIMSLLLTIIMMSMYFTIIDVSNVSAKSANDADVFLKQSTNYTCTLTAAAVMLRRRAIIDGGNWQAITEQSLRGTAWAENQGLYFNFSYSGMTVGHGYFSNVVGELITMLSKHPEGVVIYNTSQPHAVLITDYDSSTGNFYCGDPMLSSGRIPVAQSTLNGYDLLSKLAGCTAYWYITNKSGGSVGSDPKGVLDECTGGAGTVKVRGWAFDADNTSKALSIHVYIGGEAGDAGTEGHGDLVANKSRTDVNNVYGCGNNHGFESTITTSKRGSQVIAVYAINVGNGNNVLIGKKTVNISSPTVTKPVIAPVNIVGGKNVAITCATSGATIYYTTDGSTPTTSSKKYTTAFNVTSTATIKAIAVKSGYTNSEVASSTLTITKAAAPTITASGSAVTLKSSTSGATIYYTTNGSTPTTSSTKYTAPFTVASGTTVKAIAVASGYTNSTAASKTITIAQASNGYIFSVTQTVKAAAVTNTSDKEQKAAVIITEYENGALKDVSSSNVTFAAGETKTYNFTGSGTHKVFVWNSLDGMVPLAK